MFMLIMLYIRNIWLNLVEFSWNLIGLRTNSRLSQSNRESKLFKHNDRSGKNINKFWIWLHKVTIAESDDRNFYDTIVKKKLNILLIKAAILSGSQTKGRIENGQMALAEKALHGLRTHLGCFWIYSSFFGIFGDIFIARILV